MNHVTYCSCGCNTPVTDAAGVLLPAAQLADHFVFDGEGSLDSIELFHRAHVVGRTLRNAERYLYVVRPDGDVICRHAGVERALGVRS
jgi:hypothetical protein